MIARAAGIAATLAEGGLNTGAISWWFDQPRRELGGLSAHAALAATPAAQDAVLKLARGDIADIAHLAPTGTTA